MIVVIDDEPSVRASVTYLLESLGYVVRAYGSAVEYLSDPEPADLLLIDHAMPGMTGVEMLRRHPELTASTPTLLMSGYSEEIRQSALDAGVRQILEKPFEPATLIRAITALLAQGPSA
jgi:two-component system, LuxR family, response regulator FixJ